MPQELAICAMFDDLVSLGYIHPVDHMSDLSLPGEFVVVPSILTYSTPDLPIRGGVHTDAKLDERSQRNFPTPSPTA